ncbi:MAG: hypothetical protein IKV40_00590 [Clostridia bacterium]|nr:hypothetical protein [Clostridia bacterium]MBR5446898.1 hypothetical protein [Clostridia bacterium]
MKTGKPSLSPKGKRTLLKLLINFCIAFFVYRGIVELGKVHVMIYYVGSSIYALVIAVLFCVYYAKNGFTFSTEPALPPAGASAEEAKLFTEKAAKSKSQARSLLFIIAPMALTVMIDYVMLLLESFFA